MRPRKEDIWSYWRFWLNMVPSRIDLMEEEIHRFTMPPTKNTLTLWYSLFKGGALLYVINKERMSAFTYAVIVGHLGTERYLHRYGGFMHFRIQHWRPALRCVTTSYSNVVEAFLYLKDFASSRQRWLSDFDRVRVGETLYVFATRWRRRQENFN